MGHSLSFYNSVKQKAKNSISQTAAINNCFLCSERLKTIEAHHPNSKKLLSTVKDINKCPTCRETLKAIIICAKNGHIPGDKQ